MLHHFKHICHDKNAFTGVTDLKKFIKIINEQALNQTYYSSTATDPMRGRNKYFGDAGESLVEAFLNDLGNHKSINCTNYNPAEADEFGIDGMGWYVRENGTLGRLAVQIKLSSDSNHYYDSHNSNILNAVAALKVLDFDRLLFVNTGAGINPKLLNVLNQKDSQLVYQVNYKDLSKLIDKSPIIWANWFNSLFDI